MTAQKGVNAQKANDTYESNRLNQLAYEYYYKAENLIAREERQLKNKTRMNRATIAANLGKFKESENIFQNLLEQDPNNLLYYYNMACLYSQWGKLDLAIEQLNRGIQKGMAESGELCKKDLIDDPDFVNLRSSKDPKIKERYLALLNRLP